MAMLLVLLFVFALFNPIVLAEDAINVDINTPGTFNVSTSSNYQINGYLSSAQKDNYQFVAMTIAGSKVGSNNKAVAVSCASPSGFSKYFNVKTKTPSGIIINSLSYTGTGVTSGNTSYADKIALTFFYIRVDADMTMTSTNRTINAYPYITSSI